ncbi:dehydroshikimate dehydratase QsuB [Microbacterium kribbense]|uniref:3-dehydroshikimate dehydratase n=2 Tax=Microbacterium kribbense TaxID=433645 RepID=A0ABP7G529_9MICO
MRTSIATVSIGGTLEAKLEAARSAGFDGIEIFENDLISSFATPRQIRSWAERLGLRIDLYQPFRDFEGVPAEQLSANLRRAEAKLDLAAELGAATMLVCSNVATATIDDDRTAADQLRRLGDLAAERGVRIAYEALAWGRFVNTYRRSWQVVERTDHPSVGLCLDSFHIFSRSSTLAEMGEIPGAKIFFCQIADAPLMDLDPLSWSRHYRLFPGQGGFPLPEFMSAVLSTGYDGPISIEVFNDVFRQTDPIRTARDAHRSLRYLEDLTARATISTPASPMPLERLPPASTIRTHDFVEIHGTVAGELSNLLTGLGFRPHGTHRSKPVALWTLGEVRLVLDDTRSPGSNAKVTALGFEVDDPVASAARADQLNITRLSRETAAGEQVLYGIAAPDGTEVYFCAPHPGSEPAWAREFSKVDAAEHEAVLLGSVTLDHVALTEPWYSFDEAILYYRATLGLEPEQSVDVADAYGLVRSQALRSADGAIALVLNVQPLSESPPVHHRGADHIALRVSDLPATVRRLRRAGMRMLEIPANYYADLRARYGLTDEVVAQLQDLDLLFDRDDRGGEFLQCYTRTVGSVFFELVQRTGGYDGFGAANSSVRRVAQMRSPT